MLEKCITLKVGKNHTLVQLVKELVDFGYEKVSDDLASGKFLVVGGSIRLFPIRSNNPILVEYFGDEIESIKSFDLETHKSIASINEILIAKNILLLSDKSIVRFGDYLVHEDHGIGLYISQIIKKVNGEIIEYILMQYLNDNLLYVPLNQLNKLSAYIGLGRKKPKLSRLGGVGWKKSYQKTYDNVIQMARELLYVYATREITLKKPRVINVEWNEELIRTFGFVETEDQISAIENIYNDLQDEKPMDRLVCGDVGFGKTEIAIRAAGQTVANGYQVALLVPTTILAEQHYITLKKRFASLPVNISRLSRFVEVSEQTKILKNIENGSVDIVVGTHKLLTNNLKFKNLGLLVIDEEQKFGVKHKEKLKKIRENIDVLTLTATPIPRTLFMSLSGIRDISMISSVPMGRQCVETKVEKYNDELIDKYIQREIGRKGQVYYLHNKVITINKIRDNFRKKFPNLVIEGAHGQMGEGVLSDIMQRFADGRIDMLVCSTIIENGLDLPNANTLIIDEADRFGLSQLYQIRGRVGRSKNKAYALFTYRAKAISSNASKRLKALLDNTELGSGYNIALSDLEIRGGGNVLGRDQHGNMEAVGLVLYSKMLKRAIEQLRSNEHFVAVLPE